MTTLSEMTTSELESLKSDVEAAIRKCSRCGRVLPEAIDQTDPADDETTIDSRGLVARNEWVCGACLDEAESD